MKTTDGRDSEPIASPPALVGPAAPALRPAGAIAAAAAANAAAGGAGFDAFSLLRALRRRWALAFVLAALAAPAAAALAFFFYPEKYSTQAILQVNQEAPRVMFSTQEAQTKFEVLQNTQKALIKSHLVLDQVLADPQIAQLPTVRDVVADGGDPYAWLVKQLVVDFPPTTELMTISMSGRRPKDLAELVNKVVDTYTSQIVTKQSKERGERLERLKQLWDQYQRDMKAKRERLRSLAVKAGSDDSKTLAVKQQLADRQLALIEEKQFNLKSNIMQLKVAAKAYDDQTPGAAPQVDPVLLDRHVENVAEVKQAREEIAALQDRYNSARRIARKTNDPSLTRARQDLADALQDLEALKGEARAQILRELQSGGASKDPIDKPRLAEQIRMFEEFAQELDKEAERLRSENQQQNEMTLDLGTEKADLDRMAEIAQKVGQEAQITEVELNAPSRVIQIDKAQVPRGLDQRKKLQATAMASMGALALVLFGVSFWEVRARRINTMDQVVHGLGLRVVGALPALPTGSRRSAGMARSAGPDWQSVLVESVDATRAMLLYASRMDDVRIVIVTSAQMGEGKTSLASHLAASLARAGRRTLLIDCDLRRPAIHRLFDLPIGPGVSELLRHEANLSEILQPSPANHLMILTAGQADDQSMEAIGRGDLETLFEEMKSQFDFLIIDSAPVLPVADTLLISQHVDAAIFSIMHEVSRVPMVQAAYERLAGLGVPILGAVVAGTSDCSHYGPSSYHYQRDKTAQAS